VGGAGRVLGEYWGVGKGGVGEAEGGQPDDDDRGEMAVENHRSMIGGVLQPKTSTVNGGVSERKGGRGRELNFGSSAPNDLSMVSWGNKHDGNVVPHVQVVASTVGAAPISPAVEFCEVGAGAGWEHQSSTKTTPWVLPLP
jgi:hypothetical protein